jgi:hypothetical protein
MHLRKITEEQLHHLPSELHKTVAQILIDKGEWIIQENTTSGNCTEVAA